MGMVENRRMQILQLLKDQGAPISGTALAKALGVTRQVIVQDIALIRAENHNILSTNKGYIYREVSMENTQPKRVFYVKHTTEQVLDEFLTVLELGGTILDVAVEHEIYGQIRVDLLIETSQDAHDFVERLTHCRDNPLKALTDRRTVIGDVHGTFMECGGIRLYPMYHPASMIYNRSLREVYREDVLRLAEWLRSVKK